MGGFNGLIDRVLHRRAVRRWQQIADVAGDLTPDALRRLRAQARQMRRPLDQVLHLAEGRLALPLLGANPIRHPPGTDWTWRPELWRGPLPVPGIAAVETRTEIGPGTTLFHDCRISELTLRQLRNTRETDLAPFGLRLDVFRFDGSFLSLVLDLPETALSGLKLRHLIRLEAIIEVEKPLEIFARLQRETRAQYRTDRAGTAAQRPRGHG